jgi:hypothetical protein
VLTDVLDLDHVTRAREFGTAGLNVDLYLLTKPDSTAIELGLGWLAVGLIYLAVLTEGFRKAPPEVQFSEDVNPGEPARADSTPRRSRSG